MGEAPFGGPPAAPGTVYLVGGGPGDPGLLSLRAARLLATASVVAYDRLAPAAALALCPAGCELVDVGKQPDRHKLSQEEINALLVDRAKAGEAVVRLKGGDPFVLGRGSEEAAACTDAAVPYEVVPGVTAGVAATAYAGIPVTHRGLAPAFAVVTGHEDPTKPGTQVDYAALAAFEGTLVLYMGVGRLASIAGQLAAAGKPAATPVAVIEWGTTPRQRTVTGTLADIAAQVEAAGLANPSVIVVGDTVGLRSGLRWFDTRPLHGRSVLVPRTRQQASELAERLRALGAEPVEAPTIAIEPAREPDRLRRALADAEFGWFALTSANAVEAVWEQVTALGADARLFAGTRLAVVGAGTAAALARHGLTADLVADPSTARALADTLAEREPPQRILVPRADIAAPTLAEVLTWSGWEVADVEAYRTVPAERLPDGVAERLLAGDIDVVAFSSSSTARNLVALLGGPPHPDVRLASIGPSTSKTCAELGLRIDAEADPHDLDGLVAAVVEVVSVA
jgi:uroporphyrinogen III methyltransferase / synthase